MKIIWSRLAVDRVSETAEYIDQNNPSAAEKWTDTIFAKVDQLRSFPKIRGLVCCNYRIICRIEEKRLSILTVRHGRQILPADGILT
jgi:plasmid stabilization system protein ParE